MQYLEVRNQSVELAISALVATVQNNASVPSVPYSCNKLTKRSNYLLVKVMLSKLNYSVCKVFLDHLSLVFRVRLVLIEAGRVELERVASLRRIIDSLVLLREAWRV